MSHSTNSSSRKRDSAHLDAEAAQHGAQTPNSPKRQRMVERGEDAKVNAAWEQQQALASTQADSSSNNSANAHAGTLPVMQAVVIQSIHSLEAQTLVGTFAPQ